MTLPIIGLDWVAKSRALLESMDRAIRDTMSEAIEGANAALDPTLGRYFFMLAHPARRPDLTVLRTVKGKREQAFLDVDFGAGRFSFVWRRIGLMLCSAPDENGAVVVCLPADRRSMLENRLWSLQDQPKPMRYDLARIARFSAIPMDARFDAAPSDVRTETVFRLYECLPKDVQARVGSALEAFLIREQGPEQPPIEVHENWQGCTSVFATATPATILKALQAFPSVEYATEPVRVVPA